MTNALADFFSSYQAGNQIADQQRGQRQQNQLAQLASQSYGAQPDQQQGILSQMAAIDPKAAQTQQTAFQGQEDRRNKILANMSSMLVNSSEQARPSLYRQILPGLQQLGIQAPPEYNEQTAGQIDQTAHALYQAFNGAGSSAQGVQSTYVDDQGNRIAIMRDGSTRQLGANNQNIRVLEQEGALPYGVVTSGGRAGQVVNLGGAQSGQSAYIDPSLPPEVQAQIRQAEATGQQVPSQMYYQGGLVRTPTAAEKAAATESAKLGVQAQYLPQELGMRSQAAIQQTVGQEQAKSQIQQQATSSQRARDAGDTLNLLSEAERLLPNATGSRAGVITDQLAGAFGKSTEGAQATAQLQTIAGQLTSKMPRMQGPQSDRDVQLYQQMAGDLANPAIPVATRQAALQTIRSLNEKYAGGNQLQTTQRVVDDPSGQRTAVRRGRLPDGRTVVQYSDGTTDYGN